MANSKHLRILDRGVEAWNQFFEKNPNTRPDLSGLTLTGVNLKGANHFYCC